MSPPSCPGAPFSIVIGPPTPMSSTSPPELTTWMPHARGRRTWRSIATGTGEPASKFGRPVIFRSRRLSSMDDNRRLLKITGRPNFEAGSPVPVAIDLQVRLPRAWGIHVVNSGGEVELIGVGGPITIENGAPGQEGGDIQVRTGVPIKDAVNVRTTSGRVVYQVGPGSTGNFDLQTPSGTPEVTAEVGTLDKVSMQPDRWRSYEFRLDQQCPASGLCSLRLLPDVL